MRKNSIRILFLFVALFLVFILKSNVKAFTFTHNETEYTLADLPADSENFNSNYYLIFNKSGSTLYHLLSLINFNPDTMCFFTTNQPWERAGITMLSGDVVEANNLGARVKFWSYEIGDTGWTLDSWQPNSCYYSYNSGLEDIDKFIYSTVDIYVTSSFNETSSGVTMELGEIGFPQIAPPQVMTILAPVVEVQKGAMETTLQEIVQILPLILVVVVSLVGLRKALAMLSNLLRQS